MESLINKLNLKVYQYCTKKAITNEEIKFWSISNKSLAQHIYENFGTEYSGKRIPIWIKNLRKDKLKILLDAFLCNAVKRDGNAPGSYFYVYYTTCKKLLDDIQEIALKSGYPSRIVEKEKKGRSNLWYISIFTDGENINPGITSQLYITIKRNYNKPVYCFEVPNRLFIVRCNGCVYISHNTYATTSAGLEVLRDRYLRFRETLESWLKKKIFAPISKLQDFYDYDGKEKKLDVPEIIWNKINLKDIESYVNTLIGLLGDSPESARISEHTVFESLDIDWDVQNRELEKN